MKKAFSNRRPFPGVNPYKLTSLERQRANKLLNQRGAAKKMTDAELTELITGSLKYKKSNSDFFPKLTSNQINSPNFIDDSE